jgi:glycosyltransferase involved in cell wall biosynthesis
MTLRFAVAQIGARMHYAVPRMLYQAGMLEQFYTDIYANDAWLQILTAVPARIMPAVLRRLSSRRAEGLPNDCVTAFNSLGLRYSLHLMRAKNPSQKTHAHLRAGKSFCEKVVQHGFRGVQGVYAFKTAALELLIAAKSNGLYRVLEQQSAPRQIQKCLLNEERARFHNWASNDPDDFAEPFDQRERAEWEYADLIVCGSEFVRQGIASCGGPAERCVVVPYGVDASFHFPPRRRHNTALRVLTVGAVSLPKGSPYVLEAAKHLGGKAEFRMVGSIEVSEQPRSELRKHVELTGLIPRSEIWKHYAWADVFLLPSMYEGSATVTYEALAAGLPVICTPNTGSVVRNGLDGFVVPIRDPGAIVSVIELLLADRSLLETMSMRAKQTARSFDLESYQKRLVGVLNPTVSN